MGGALLVTPPPWGTSLPLGGGLQGGGGGMLMAKLESPRSDSYVWRISQRLCLATWDLKFMHRTLWKKLPIGGRMGHRVGNGKCPICGTLEDHERILRHCRFATYLTMAGPPNASPHIPVTTGPSAFSAAHNTSPYVHCREAAGSSNSNLLAQ